MNGQKVVKVFCHEEKAMEEFDAPQRRACAERRPRPTRYANILVPIMQQPGHICCMCCVAVVGGGLCLAACPT